MLRQLKEKVRRADCGALVSRPLGLESPIPHADAPLSLETNIWVCVDRVSVMIPSSPPCLTAHGNTSLALHISASCSDLKRRVANR